MGDVVVDGSMAAMAGLTEAAIMAAMVAATMAGRRWRAAMVEAKLVATVAAKTAAIVAAMG